ncbi:putative acc synthase [Nemania diffusa]|nr:putative acc synthase [Nemania diffusa]
MTSSTSYGEIEEAVSLNVAENPLLVQEVATYITNNLVITPRNHLGYGVGPRGSPRLKKALAAFFNSDFRAHEPVKDTDVLILPGAMAVLDALAWSICNEDEGIITPMPFYTGFRPGLAERSSGVLIPASFQGIEGYQGLHYVFNPEMSRQALENALDKASRDGVKVRAVVISNPHNPLGGCYPAETLREIARFCGSHNIHLISDEIFAKSVYENPHASHVSPFTSVSSLDLGDCIDRNLIHVAYGMGKDFCASGLRIGVLLSRNSGLIAGVSTICVFGWVPYVTQEMWASMLEDKEFLATFMAKNSRILAEHCAIVTSFLDQHKIPYYRGVNAGTFVWVDLRHYLYSQGRTKEGVDLAINKLSPSEFKVYQDRETQLFNRCLEFGVWISLGSSFSTEQLGWFRISFTVENQALQTGLQRLLRCLQVIAVEGWK